MDLLPLEPNVANCAVAQLVHSLFSVCMELRQIYSAAGDGTDLHTCRLWAYQGTSMSTPVVAGASAMVSVQVRGASVL